MNRSLIVFSSLTRLINAKFFIKVRHFVRMLINAVYMLIGFVIISLACTFTQFSACFYISLVSSIILGTASAFGESTTLGFCKGFPSTIVGYFGSGTGFAGIFGSGSLLLLKSAGLDNAKIFYVMIPTVVLYFLSFLWISTIKQKYPYVPQEVDTSILN